ncbi:MAG TPA: ABC transporter substrate-binding protein, partial [Bauldia sp.]|nr:ABC transporter substrate-binding protein [Bauldia sp.]
MHALLRLAIAAGVLAAAPALALADDAPAADASSAAPAAAPKIDLASLPPPGDWLPATSILDQPHYPAGFTHFNYVNVNAPKGGSVRLNALNQTFDTLNPILDKGTAADGLGLIYDTLMSQAVDEADIAGSYPDIANALRYPADLSYVTFRIDPNAKWHDGVPITADDVVWTFDKSVELN